MPSGEEFDSRNNENSFQPSEDTSPFEEMGMPLEGRDSHCTIEAPRNLLISTPGMGHTTELVHAGTLFSKGAVLDNGAVHPNVLEYFHEASSAGINTLYVVGIYKHSRFSKMVMPHFASEWDEKPPEHHIGPSVFSIAQMIPNANIGSWDNMEKVLDAAKNQGITLVFDFVPNTIGLDSLIARKHPEYIRDYDRPSEEFGSIQEYHQYCEANDAIVYSNTLNEVQNGIDVEHHLDVYSVNGDEQLMVHTRFEGHEEHTMYLLRDMHQGFRPYVWIEHLDEDGYQVYCKQLGTDGYTNWADVAMLETNSEEVIGWQAEMLKTVGERTPIVRADMSHLPARDYWSRLADKVESIGGTMPEIWGEAYGAGVHDELAQRNIHTYANFIREWLTAPEVNVPAIMHQLFSDPAARAFYERGMSVAYTANHDDEMGHYLPREGATATILCALPVNKIMLAQGQRHGDTRRYGADQHVPMHDYRARVQMKRRQDPGYATHMDKLVPLMDRDVFRSPHSDWSPVHFASLQDRDLLKIFNIVRTLGDEKVLTVVDCQDSSAGAEIVVDVAASFRVERESLGEYSLVNLLSGEVRPAENFLHLPSNPEEPGFSSHMYALVTTALSQRALLL